MNFRKAEFVMSALSASKIPAPSYPEFVFSGRSNVGKSSLINTLLERKSMARVSSTPGKTASINFFLIDEQAYLCDLPGYGYARVSKSEQERWKNLVEGYLRQKRNVRLVLQLVDARIGATKDDLIMVDYLYQMGFPFIVIATKTDKLSKTKQAEQIVFIKDQLHAYGDVLILPFSSKNKTGRKEVIDIMEYQMETEEE